MGNETKNLWLSLGAGVFATFLLYSYSQEKKAEYDKQFGASKRVIVAKQDIAEMQTIYDTMVETVERPGKYLEPDAVSIPEEIVGNVAAIPIKKGQQITKNQLLTPGPDTGISLQVAPTKRALAIPVDETRAVAKLIRPGDRIDIIVALDAGKGLNSKRETSVLMQDVTVLATGVSVLNNIPRVFDLDASGKNLSGISLSGDSKYNTITIEVSPKDAQDMVFLLSTQPGNIFMILRNPNDRAIAPRMPSSTAESVLGKPVITFDPSALRGGAGLTPQLGDVQDKGKLPGRRRN